MEIYDSRGNIKWKSMFFSILYRLLVVVGPHFLGTSGFQNIPMPLYSILGKTPGSKSVGYTQKRQYGHFLKCRPEIVYFAFWPKNQPSNVKIQFQKLLPTSIYKLNKLPETIPKSEHDCLEWLTNSLYSIYNNIPCRTSVLNLNI